MGDWPYRPPEVHPDTVGPTLNALISWACDNLPDGWKIVLSMRGGADGNGDPYGAGEAGLDLIDPTGRCVSDDWDGDSLNVWDMVDHARDVNSQTEATEPKTHRGVVVADTLNHDCCIDPEECRKIARLIAAAPALLAVAECSEAWDLWSYGRSDKATMEAVFTRYGWDGTVTHPKWLDTFRRAAIHNAIGGAR